MPVNSHYVPQLTLRRFGDKLCLFNVQDGSYKENVNIDKAFSEKGFYSDEVEEKLQRRIESQFANLFHNKINKAESILELSRDELYLVKKFLLISVIRSYGTEEYLEQEKHFYDNEKIYWYKFAKEKGMSEKEIEEGAKNIKPPFIEKEIIGETAHEYWLRTLNVILDTNGTKEEIMKHPDKTYPAYRWAEVINNGYLAFWDSEYIHDEFVITDVGMTSENEKGWNGVTQHNIRKTNFLLSCLQKEKDPQKKLGIFSVMNMHHCFTENFMMFPISAKRMIVEIDPFFKFRIFNKEYYDMPKLEDLTMMPNEKLFYPNTNYYVLPQKPLEAPVYHKDDKYIYEIKKLTSRETMYCNELFMDRINTYLGFTSLNKVVKSVFSYKKANSYPYVPRVDYTELYKIINERFGATIDIESIGGFRR